MKKILIAYATRVGSTIEVAQAIADVLTEWGAKVEVRSTNERIDIDRYDAVILGSAIRVGKWLPEAVDFLKTHYDALSTVPTAFFVACMTLHDDCDENRKLVLSYLDPVFEALPDVRPVSIGLFAGEVNPAKLSLPIRLFIRANKVPCGDFRDWDAIRRWASSIAPTLLGEPEMLYP